MALHGRAELGNRATASCVGDQYVGGRHEIHNDKMSIPYCTHGTFRIGDGGLKKSMAYEQCIMRTV
jgi:hypothetical protein